MSVCCECCVLSRRGLFDGPIPRSEKFYQLWCVTECDLETTMIRRPWPALGCCSKNKTKIVTWKDSVQYNQWEACNIFWIDSFLEFCTVPSLAGTQQILVRSVCLVQTSKSLKLRPSPCLCRNILLGLSKLTTVLLHTCISDVRVRIRAGRLAIFCFAVYLIFHMQVLWWDVDKDRKSGQKYWFFLKSCSNLSRTQSIHQYLDSRHPCRKPHRFFPPLSHRTLLIDLL